MGKEAVKSGGGSSQVLEVNNSSELLSYIINVTPELSGEIDLPKQGESITPYGKLIMNNQRYRNAFLNTINLIGLTAIKRNAWEYPWEFTRRGTLRFGQQIREIINDLVKANDYNEKVDVTDEFLKTQVPNCLQYIHELNFQKFYRTTTSDEQMAMAFENEDLFTYIDDAISMLYESMTYDEFQVNKYMLCRRILDGTVSPYTLTDFSTNTVRQNVSLLKSVSNKMTFRSPNYNPAGLRRATKFADQIMIVNTDFDAKITTEVLATSFFRNDAEMKTNLALIDGFEVDDARLSELLGTNYTAFTAAEKTALAKIPAVLISREWFMDYNWAFDMGDASYKQTEFYNPTTLRNNHFLHVWKVFSTSPFENACVFTPDTQGVISVTVNPATATITAGESINLSANVVTTGFANQAVIWSLTDTDTHPATINVNGTLHIPAEHLAGDITITATSVYDNTKTGTATITIVARP